MECRGSDCNTDYCGLTGDTYDSSRETSTWNWTKLESKSCQKIPKHQEIGLRHVKVVMDVSRWLKVWGRFDTKKK